MVCDRTMVCHQTTACRRTVPWPRIPVRSSTAAHRILHVSDLDTCCYTCDPWASADPRPMSSTCDLLMRRALRLRLGAARLLPPSRRHPARDPAALRPTDARGTCRRSAAVRVYLNTLWSLSCHSHVPLMAGIITQLTLKLSASK